MKLLECLIIPFTVAALVIYCAYIGEPVAVAYLVSALAVYAGKGWIKDETD